jgi:hypothetical protein
MNNRANTAALLAIDLRYWAEQASILGLLRPGVRQTLERIADDVTIDAQLSISYPPEPPPPRPGHKHT